jgi:hypothetical protein
MDQTLVAEQPRPLTGLPAMNTLVRLSVWLAVGLLIFVALYRQKAPQAVAAGAPPGEFAAGRALAHLRALAARPHPLGSPAHEQVCDYIRRELSALGVAPEVQRTTVVNEKWDSPMMAGTVSNVAAVLKGTGGGKAVMLAAHYDSVPAGAGAADDGAGVAALLETLRALKQGPPLKNDVVFLFTDGEEAGLLGSEAFVKEHPWAQRIGLVLNFEARGSGGPALMFETSAGNGWLIGEFARAAPYPVTNSLMQEAYKILPNDTDLSVFKGAGMAGLNFAFIDEPTHYHSPLDSVENLDANSLQHQGSYALALARHFGNLDLSAPQKKGDAVYFDLLGRAVVRYPAAWVMPLAGLTALLFAVVLALGFRSKRLRPAGFAWGVLAFFLSLLGTGLLVALVRRLVYAAHAGYGLMPSGGPYNSNLYLLGFTAISIAVTASVHALLARRADGENLWAGALAWWLLLLLAAGLLTPGASYLLTWPLLFSLAALAWVLTRGSGERAGAKRAAVVVAGAAPGLLLLPPLVYTLFVGLGLELAWAVLLVAVLLLGVLIPQLGLVRGARRWALPGAAAVLSLLFLAAGSFTAGFDDRHPRPTNVFYGLNADTQQATWASTNGPDAWTSQFIPAGTGKRKLPEIFLFRSPEFFAAQAPAAALPAPAATILSDRTENGVRTLRLRLTSPRAAPVLTCAISSATGVRATAINGKPVAAAAEASTPQTLWGLRYYALPREGIELTLQTKPAQPLEVRVVDQSYGLPELTGTAYKARPGDMMAAPLPFNDSTYVSKSFTF